MTSKYEPPTTPARTTRGSPRPTIVKPMVEKSPNAVSVLTRARRSWISGTENVGVLGADARRALADVDEPVLVAVDERPQQHAADDAEDGGVGADAERQREDDGDGQALDPGERPEGEPEIGEEAHKHSVTRSREVNRLSGSQPRSTYESNQGRQDRHGRQYYLGSARGSELRERGRWRRRWRPPLPRARRRPAG